MKTLFKLFSLLVLTTPLFVFAQYQTLVGIPGVESGTGNFDTYLQAVYATSISLAALLAVIKIVIAGVKWMTTDIVSSKSDAKKDIEGAILGLVVILAAVLILYIINPNIGAVSLNLERAPTPPPVAAVTPESIQDRIDSCGASAACEVNACGPTDCSAEAERCRTVLNGAPTELDSSILCIRAGSESPVEGEYAFADDMIRNFFNENGDDYLSRVATYSVNNRDYRENRDLTPIEFRDSIDNEIWADECELDSEGEDTGNEFIDISDEPNGVRVTFCAQKS